MKKLILLFFVGLLFYNCSNDENSNGQIADLQNDEYILLFPISRPLNSLEINNELYVLYEDVDSSMNGLNKLSKVSSDGVILWTIEAPLNIHPNTLNFMTYDDNRINFFEKTTSGNNHFRLIQFDLNGNITNTNSNPFSNKDFDNVQKSQDYFYLTEHSSTAVYTEKYSLSGNLIETINTNTAIENPNYSRTIIKNDKTYLFSLTDFDGSAPSFHKNLSCKVYENNTLLNTINLDVSNTWANFLSSIVLDNGNIILITHSNANGTVFKLFNSITGHNIVNKEFDGMNENDAQIFLMQNGNIGFVGQTSVNDNNSKLSQFTILDSDLNVVSQKKFGSYSFGEIRYQVNESNNGNYYYITGRTFGTDGDYLDVPNNSDTIDMFLFKLSK